MKVESILTTGLLALSLLVPTPGAAASPQEKDAAATGGQSTTPNNRVKTYVEVGDPSLLALDGMTPASDSREVVDAFLVSAFTLDGDDVYDAFIHPSLASQVSREEFKDQIGQLSRANGKLSRVYLTYLRETPRMYNGVDGGWTENILVFERDPRVSARVDFRRTSEGEWRVVNYTFTSAQLDRVLRNKEAAERTAEEQEQAGEAAPAEPPTP